MHLLRGQMRCAIVGEGIQDLEHLLWGCPLVDPPPADICFRKDLPTSQAVAHILPKGSSSADITLWKKSCKRAIMIVSRRAYGDGRIVTEKKPRDTKGHEVAVTEDGAYTYCLKCHISRRSRDASWIFLRECLHMHRQPLHEGGALESRGHQAIMRMATWKHSAKRPQLHCLVCGQDAWATSGFRRECQQRG